MEITRESVTKKLGFDPMRPPKIKTEPHVVDDATPSIWAPLSREELAFVIELRTGEKYIY